MNTERIELHDKKPNPEDMSLADIWIQGKLHSLITSIKKNINNYRIDLIANSLYDFVWNDYCNWYRFDEYKDFVFNSPAAEIAGRLTQSYEIRLFHEHILVKEPKTSEPTPWHHDQPYYCVDGEQVCSIWFWYYTNYCW